MEVLQWIAKYWVEWLCALISGGAVIFARHYIKVQKQVNEDKWKEKESKMCGKIITTIEEKIQTVEDVSKKEDGILHKELDAVHNQVDTITSGILSIQGKQFKDYCISLLKPDHFITVEEYEEFEQEYDVYKELGGNHRGDALHDRVVDKFNKQS